MDCNVLFMAYAGFSKLIYGGGPGKMVDVTMAVYKFEHKHVLHSHVEGKERKEAGLGDGEC